MYIGECHDQAVLKWKERMESSETDEEMDVDEDEDEHANQESESDSSQSHSPSTIQSLSGGIYVLHVYIMFCILIS